MNEPSDPLAWIDDKLGVLEARGLLRRPAVRGSGQGAEVDFDGRRLVNFGSNDYLNLACDGRLAAAVRGALDCGCGGAGASPLVTGRSTWHARLEDRLAEFNRAEAALVFSSGYAANLAAIAALVGPGDAVFSDERNHASIIDGCRLSRAETLVYRHADAGHLDVLLAQHSGRGKRLIVTDTVFSMDGDAAPLVEIAASARRRGAMLMIDEAHATGVFGACGRGLAEALGVCDAVDVHVGTLSKALGCAGGFVTGSRRLVDWLFNRARAYVFSTAPPDVVCAAACAALDVVRDEPQRRIDLLAAAERLRKELAAQGWDTGNSSTQIVPIIVGDAVRATELCGALRSRGLFVPGIRPPTVPLGNALLRVSLTAGHSAEHVAQLVAALAELAPTLRSRAQGTIRPTPN
ncbi:MAG: 8-amino-7-oxononanoate synthase [Pirellulales bacterium]